LTGIPKAFEAAKISCPSRDLGAVVRRGEVELAISTGGVAPALAGLLREALEAVLPDDLPSWIEIARRERVAWKHRGVPMAERRPLLLRALERLYAARAPATEPRASIPESRAP
jgi:uroporphyrin-III C-methyltransferase/precorrin-2 dehydrogenase/sirohydrochlorin ferrochelatase